MDQPNPFTRNLIVTHLCKVKAMLNYKSCCFLLERLLLALYDCRLKHRVDSDYLLKQSNRAPLLPSYERKPSIGLVSPSRGSTMLQRTN